MTAATQPLRPARKLPAPSRRRSALNAPHRASNTGARRSLRELANVGPATLADFETLGIRTVPQLARQDAMRLYTRLCARTARRHDPCVIDVFLATIAQARGGTPTPWWKFTPVRKRMTGTTPKPRGRRGLPQDNPR